MILAPYYIDSKVTVDEQEMSCYDKVVKLVKSW
jgi:hypothetical protein